MRGNIEPMKAVQVTAFGPPSVLVPVELPDPTPADGEIAIDVTHAAVGLVDLFLRQGIFKDQPWLPKPPFVPGLEVAGTVRALGKGVSGFTVGEKVVAFSTNGAGGYASVRVVDSKFVFSLEGRSIDLATAVAVVPNVAMAFVALTRFGRLARGEKILVHGALGGFASAFPGVARHLGAARVVGTVRPSKLGAAAATKLPYDAVLDSTALPEQLGGETFDLIVDPVGGVLRTQSLDWLAPGGRLLLVGNASGAWDHVLPSNRLWFGSTTVVGFAAGSYLPTHGDDLRAGVEAALEVVARGLAETVIDSLPLEQARVAHERMESRALDGRIVLVC